ncbi:2-hydroxychromene-2-carboxylate isomerase [Jannaschia pagri]|uniref:2-hydroxychromene-2-carboxylate isomerase n=1 Tax=Jannaschia pagri TaxID=2829797 RepID=A0ABQ4NHE2_9RHOB|nr:MULTISPECIES: 2-hydroxychromene-2-carboxylate isomerase [unclassified Jannaschia]GIT90294.1 2-hydroxychromene-2-carboxylate isomerase [Jannaschia sp. AI_61]GIT93600.1 2-hydroxychromene-2-carboxylate isomerase [Jannaschia sp. AI_62]
MAVIEYIYSAHSAFAYLGSAHLRSICATHGATLIHRPIPLSPVVEAQGSLPFAARTQAHVDYFFGREIERWAEWREVPVLSYRPTYHDADYTLASHLIIACGDRGPLVDAVSHAILRAHWCDDADLSDERVLRAVIDALGMDTEALMQRANLPEVADAYARNCADAQALGVMGSPTYVVDGEIYYGQDRLEMVERALTQPFRPSRWRNPPVDG